MHNRKKTVKITLAVMGTLFLALFVFWLCIHASVRRFNETPRTAEEEETVLVETAARGGSTDSWNKGFTIGTMRGRIYETTVQNGSDYEISDWSERIDITSQCYLNNGWCGTFEIHQFSSGSEIVNTLDLRSYDASEITLEHRIENQELLIPLEAGDYFIYYPSTEVYESPLDSGFTSTIGFILYYRTEEPDLTRSTVTFYYRIKYPQLKSFLIFLVLLCLWGVAAIVEISLYIFSANAARELARKDKNLEESIGIFSGFVDAKDTYTNGHAKRVALYAEKIARAMGYSEKKCRDVYYIGLMHDVGKCFIPDEILKKPSRLTDEEYAVIQSHTVKGYELLAGFSSLQGIREGALNHHERFDGKGYPNGKTGKDIPEIGRILCIADSYDAMNSKRVYRDPLPKEVIRAELENGSGTQFDPDILKIFERLLDSGEII